MAKMTPEQEAEHALDHGVARSELPESARLAYDRLVEKRDRAAVPPAPSRVDDESPSGVTLSLWRRMLASIVLATVGVVLGVMSLWLYLSSPGSLATPSNVAITVKSSVPLSTITYLDQQNSGNEYFVGIAFGLSAVRTQSASPVTVSLTVSWPGGSKVQPASDNCIAINSNVYCASPSHILNNSTNVIGENVVSQARLRFQPDTGVSSFPLYSVTADNLGYDFNSIAASVAIPEVAYQGPGTPILDALYIIPSASRYAWSFVPTPIPNGIRSGGAEPQWSEVFTNGKALAQVISGTDTTNETRANLITFINGALVGLAGAAILSAAQELFHMTSAKQMNVHWRVRAQGGWEWLASDGQWYPQQLAPAGFLPPAPVPPQPGNETK